MIAFRPRMNITVDGALKATLTADSALTYDVGNRFEFRHVRVVFVRPDQYPLSSLQADHATYWVAPNQLMATGSVTVLRLADSALLQTDSLLFDPARNEIRTTKPWAILPSPRVTRHR